MACDCCTRSRTSQGGYRLFCPNCLWCGARLIQNIQRLPIVSNEKVTRCRAVLARWCVEWEHPEAELRRLAKLPHPPYEPEPATPRKRKKK